MIFVGDGALLRRAVTHAAATGHRVDLVCCDDPRDAAGAPHLSVPDLDARADTLEAACGDGIVWSLNNRRIFGPALLARNLRILNIHNGLLPQHRGLPSVAVLFALLHGDPEYGATLHEVDAGIDTGRVLAEWTFPVAPDERYHQVMLRGILACQALFEQMLPRVAAGADPVPPPAAPGRRSAYYGRRALTALAGHRGHPDFARATDLGPFAAHAPEVVRALAALRDAPAAGPR
jgi:methionyl-tRNA formyltransferase